LVIADSAAPRNNTLNTPNLIAIKPPKNPPAISSLMTLLPKIFGGYSGTIVEVFGYSEFFILTTLIGLPILYLVYKDSAAPRNNTLNTPNLIAIKPPKNPPAMVMNRPNVLATVAISILLKPMHNRRSIRL
jgi:hypothetical protein